jgi:acetylornithine/N-succinyldiaminopimelate aminotransferase
MNTAVVPDILTTAKGLGGGFPIGVMLTTAEVGNYFKPGSHGSTFGGNPLACAVSEAAFDLINDPALLAGVRAKAERAAAVLRDMGKRLGCFSEIRHAGLWFGCELTGPLTNRAGDLVGKGAANGVLMLQAGPNVLRIATSLIISDEELDEGLRRLEKTCVELLG